MKESYPRYGRFGLEKIYRGWPQFEVEQVEQFVSYCAIGAASRKLGDIRRTLIQFRDVVESNNEPLAKVTSHRWIKEMGAAVALDIFPYLLRHTRAHELYSKMPSKIAQKFMGHNSDMSELYAHISSRDIKDSILKTVYNVADLPKEKKHHLELEVARLRKAMDLMCQKFPDIARIIAQNPSEENVEEQIRKRRPNGTLDV